MLISPEPAVASPCIQVCTLDEEGVCTGCLRTQNEIMLWTRMTEAGQRDILQRCQERAKALRSAAISADK